MVSWVEVIIADCLWTLNSVEKKLGPSERVVWWPEGMVQEEAVAEESKKYVGDIDHMDLLLRELFMKPSILKDWEKEMLFLRIGKGWRFKKIGKKMRISREKVRRDYYKVLRILETWIPSQKWYNQDKVNTIVFDFPGFS